MKSKKSDIWQKFNYGKQIRIGITIFAGILILLWLSYKSSFDIESQQEEIQPTPQQKNIINPTPTISAKRVEGQILVKFKPTFTDVEIKTYLQRYNAKVINKIEAINRYVIQVPPAQEDYILKQLSQDSMIENAEPNYYMQLFFVPNDQYLTNQWYLDNKGQAINNKAGKAHADIDVEAAWDVTKGAGVKVAVLDTGIDLNHPDLAGKVVAQKDFVGTGIDDKFGHGTHVAGTLAADTNNSTGIAGVCPDCKLIIGKTVGDNGAQTDIAVISQGITWAADQGAKAINLSEGTDVDTQTLGAAAAYAWSKGSVVVAAAGNGDIFGNGTTNPFYPAAYPNVVSVAATDNNDAKAKFSNYGTWVQVAAPGASIFSTMPTHSYAMQQMKTLNLNYDYLDGTSMASPEVTGVVALIWATSFGTSNSAVVQRLYSTADKIPGTGSSWVNGRINAAKAVGAGTVPTVAPTQAVNPNPSSAQTSIPTPTDTPAPASTSQPLPTQSNGGVPSQFCLGSCPTPTVMPPISNSVPDGGGEMPIGSPVNTQPGSSPDQLGLPDSLKQWQNLISKKTKKKIKNKKFLNNLISILIGFINLILSYVMSLFGK